MAITVMIVDDHLIIRRGIRSMLEGQADISVVAEASDAVEAMCGVRERMPDVVFLDLKVPGAGGLDLCCDIMSCNPGGHVVILSAFINRYLLQTCLSLGVDGYMTKPSQSFSPADVARQVYSGGKAFDAQAINILSAVATGNERSSSILTIREIQVLQGLGKGLSNVEIATELGLTENTIKGYVKNILVKLDVHNRTGAVTKGFELGLI